MSYRGPTSTVSGVVNWSYRGDATSEGLTSVRRRFASWVEQAGCEGVMAVDVVVATYEAMANVVDHAYLDGAGVMLMHANVRDDKLSVTVSDHGRWQPPGRYTGRGRGLKLIQAIADAVNLTSTDDGTTVVMCWKLHPDH